ncbi:hypothetical protein CAEBREN_08680 [Caenorhabditis brenneri]|uniref:F-box domain-containing protein n=1 Tax=Caenorhabditis brenneri TaxID=135651 RepID=G0MB86_CAEBE|nr:hypothetical protein CAEBREN_08680 [Caenorhabditis brenneri]
MVEESFPLLKLPVDVTKHVVQCMPDIERVSISFCSNRMKSMAIFPGVRPRNFLVTLVEIVQFHIKKLTFVYLGV